MSNVERMEGLLGSKRTLLVAATLIVGGAFVLLGLSSYLAAVAVLIVVGLTFSLPRIPIFSAYMNRYIPSDKRATVLSLTSMCRTLAIVVVLHGHFPFFASCDNYIRSPPAGSIDLTLLVANPTTQPPTKKTAPCAVSAILELHGRGDPWSVKSTHLRQKKVLADGCDSLRRASWSDKLAKINALVPADTLQPPPAAGQAQ